jgi:SAM-dependent methyltransferase
VTAPEKFLERLSPSAALTWIATAPRRLGVAVRRKRDFARLRRTIPIRPHFGYSDGQCVDRYYIETFLAMHATDVRGRVLEIQGNFYTRLFGREHVNSSDVLDIVPGPQTTIMADLTQGDSIPSNSFDCIICTQTLHLIYDVAAAIRTLERILKPGGVLLVTVPGIIQIDRDYINTCGDYWRFTTLCITRLFEEVFPHDAIQAGAYGNVLSAIAFLHGILADELHRHELDYRDPDYEVTIAVRATKHI